MPAMSHSGFPLQKHFTRTLRVCITPFLWRGSWVGKGGLELGFFLVGGMSVPFSFDLDVVTCSQC